MSDEKLRELERRFRETGSPDDELAWLRECARSGEKLDWDSYSRLHELDVEAAADYLRWRVGSGDLSASRLRLAGRLGHPAALRVFRDCQPGDVRALSKLESSELAIEIAKSLLPEEELATVRDAYQALVKQLRPDQRLSEEVERLAHSASGTGMIAAMCTATILGTATPGGLKGTTGPNETMQIVVELLPVQVDRLLLGP